MIWKGKIFWMLTQQWMLCVISVWLFGKPHCEVSLILSRLLYPHRQTEQISAEAYHFSSITIVYIWNCPVVKYLFMLQKESFVLLASCKMYVMFLFLPFCYRRKVSRGKLFTVFLRMTRQLRLNTNASLSKTLLFLKATEREKCRQNGFQGVLVLHLSSYLLPLTLWRSRHLLKSALVTKVL